MIYRNGRGIHLCDLSPYCWVRHPVSKKACIAMDQMKLRTVLVIMMMMVMMMMVPS